MRGILSSSRNHDRMNKSSFSAFSSPGAQRHLPRNNSPAPSMIASESSESTLKSPNVDYSRATTGYNNQFDSFALDPSYQPPRTKPQVSQYSFAEKYNLTPIQNQINEPRPSVQQQDSFPQCQGNSHSMKCWHKSCNQTHYVNYAPPMHNQVIQSSHRPPFCHFQPNAPESFNSPVYCRPAVDLSNPMSANSTRSNLTHDTSSYHTARAKSHGDESPSRPRNKSMDSFDSTLSPLSNNSSDESTSCVSPLPQNLKGDPHRQSKVKTELCLHYARGKECPFGSRCNYAHGEHELKYTKLFELKDAGLVEDVSIYRTHPCASWVATGAW